MARTLNLSPSAATFQSACSFAQTGYTFGMVDDLFLQMLIFFVLLTKICNSNLRKIGVTRLLKVFWLNIFEFLVFRASI
jgi:hypothetical protein